MKQLKVIFTVALLGAFILAMGQEVSYTTIENISYREGNTDFYMNERCVLDLYYPKNIDDFATIVWFHGGGLKEGEKHIPKEFLDEKIAVVAVNYRKSPMAQHPAYIEDAAASVAWVFNNIEKYGGDIGKIFVSGHSAGGYLTLMIGLDPQWLNKYSIETNSISALFPISDQTITHTTIREERDQGKRHRLADEYAPLYHTRGDAAPLYLITGDRDLEIPARYEESALMYAYMKSMSPSNVYLYELDGFNHVTVAGPACSLIVDIVK